MDDLTAFLLARLAEMEAPAIEVRDKVAWRREVLGADDTMVWVIDDDYRHDTLGVRHQWVLADIEAKRHMIGYALEPNDQGDQDGFLLQLLALPFANHPDYSEAWRPEAWELSPIPELKP